MDKLFLRRELFSLRCSFKNLPILGPILIGPLFDVVFYTRDGLVFSLAHGYRSVRPICPGLSGLVFILFSCPLHAIWSVAVCGRGPIGWHSNKYMLTVQCSWVDGRDTDMNDDKYSLDDGWKCWVDGNIISGVTVEISSGRWQSLWDDG